MPEKIKNMVNAEAKRIKRYAAVIAVAWTVILGGLEIELDADTKIKADERKFKQIMFNLLSNAIKFTPDGGSVRVSARKVSDVGAIRRVAQEEGRGSASPLQGINFIEISVTDTGIGIKEEDIPKLFHEFTQLESAYTKNFEGTGLGLALTRKLVELNGGRIWVESEFGKGSRFVFVIPEKQKKSESSSLAPGESPGG